MCTFRKKEIFPKWSLNRIDYEIPHPILEFGYVKIDLTVMNCQINTTVSCVPVSVNVLLFIFNQTYNFKLAEFRLINA